MSDSWRGAQGRCITLHAAAAGLTPAEVAVKLENMRKVVAGGYDATLAYVQSLHSHESNNGQVLELSRPRVKKHINQQVL